MVTPSRHPGGSSHLPIALAWTSADLSGADGDGCQVTSHGWGLVLLSEGNRASEVPWSHGAAPQPSVLETPSSLLVPPEPSKGHSGMPATPSGLPQVPAPGVLRRWTVGPHERLCPLLSSERFQARSCWWRPSDTFGWASVPRVLLQGPQVPARQFCREPSPGPGLVDSEGEGRHDLGRAEWCGCSRRRPPGRAAGVGRQGRLCPVSPAPTQEPSPASPPEDSLAIPRLGPAGRRTQAELLIKRGDSGLKDTGVCRILCGGTDHPEGPRLG